MGLLGGILGGLAGAVGGYLSAREQRKALENSGKVDLTTERRPWDESTPHRVEGMERGRELLQRGDGELASPRYRGFFSPSDTTKGLVGDLAARAQGGSPLYRIGERYVGGTLRGADRNPYRREAAGELREYTAGPHLDRFREQLFAGETPGGGGGKVGDFGSVGSDGAYRAGPVSYGGGGAFRGGGGGAGPVGKGIEQGLPVDAASHIREILGGKLLQENPHLDQLLARSRANVTEEFEKGALPQLLTEWGAAGRFGSPGFRDAFERMGGRLARNLADVEVGARAQDYESRMGDMMQALGLGTGLDTAVLGSRTQRAISEADNAARLGAAGIGASAQGRSDELRHRGLLEQLASGERLARMGSLADAIGRGVQADQFRLGGLMGLAEGYDGSQARALAALPEITGLSLRDLSQAIAPSLELDRLRSEAGGRGSEFDFRLWRARRDDPWNDALRYGDLVNAFSGGYGDTREFGRDQRSISPYTASPAGQALSGGLAGWYLGNQFAGGGRAGGGG